MSVYPIVKLPRKIKKAYQADLHLPVFDVQPLLQNPGQPPCRFNLGVLGSEAFLVVILGGTANYFMGWFVAGALIISGLLFLLAHIGGMQASYQGRWYEYHQQMDRFRRQQWEADFDRTRHERLQTTEGMASYRRQRVAEFLARTITPELAADEQLSLPTDFIATLSRWFPNKIYPGIGSGLMLIDEMSRLHISISIDTIPQSVAGVAAGSFLEDDQNLRQGWIVVRFSDEQILNYPDSCCKTLAEIGAELLQNPDWLHPFADVYDLWQVPVCDNAPGVENNRDALQAVSPNSAPSSSIEDEWNTSKNPFLLEVHQ
jgi:hypothetical protein